jgi:thymidylate synthase
MLAGSKDLKWIAHFNRNMESFSDNGKTINGAYGYRWRLYFGKDQLRQVVDMLRKNPADRRAVITMWDATYDLNSPSKDVP